MLTRAKTQLILDEPFFGSLILQLKYIEDKTRDTMATDGTHIFYNPSFVRTLTLAELKGVIAHEVMHLAMGHHWRMGNRNAQWWNIACDIAINDILLNNRHKLPSGALTHRDVGLPCGGSAEEIYAQIVSNIEGSPKGGSGKKQGDGDNRGRSISKRIQEALNNKSTDPGGCGEVLEIPAEKVYEEKIKWGAAVETALRQGGHSVGYTIRTAVTAQNNHTVSWQHVLRDLVEQTAKNDYNWTQPNRRYIQHGIYLPSLLSDELPEIVIAIDTSGSINNKLLAEFTTEINQILSLYKTTIHVLYCDTEVCKGGTFTSADLPLEFEPVGGGGTDFNPVFDYIEANDMTPKCLIYFTDLYGRFPAKAPNYNTVWVTNTIPTYAPHIPFGGVVQMNPNL